MDSLLTDHVADGVRARDPDAVATCYEVVAPALYRYLVGLSGNHDLAEDLVEATFLELIEYGPRLTGGGESVRKWLFRAARNNLFDARRKEDRRGDLPLEAAPADPPDPEPDPEERAVSGERDAAVRAALVHLSPDQQEVLVLRFGAELSGPEVADLTGRTLGAVKALQHRGLAALARVLGTDPDTQTLAEQEGAEPPAAGPVELGGGARAP